MPTFFLYLLLLLPFFNLIALPLTHRLGANPVEKLLLESGQGALVTLVFLLLLPVLTQIFTQFQWLKIWMRRRRTIGLTLFFYASLHLLIYVADHLGVIEKLKTDLLKPFVTTGFVSWLIFMLLAGTSNKWSRKKLKSKWKVLHKFVWISIPLLMVHLTLKEEGELYKTFFWFTPIGFAWGYKYIGKRTHR